MKAYLLWNLLAHAFSEMFLKPFKKTRSMCFIGSKTTRLRLVVLNPIKYSCSFCKHYIKLRKQWTPIFLSKPLRWGNSRSRQGLAKDQRLSMQCLKIILFSLAIDIYQPVLTIWEKENANLNILENCSRGDFRKEHCYLQERHVLRPVEEPTFLSRPVCRRCTDGS